MTDAQKILAMVKRAQAKGRACAVSLTRLGTPGAYNPATGGVEGGSDPVTYTAFGVKVGYEQSMIDGSLILRGDEQVYVPALGFTRPATSEQLTVAGITYTIVSVETLAPGEADVLYVIQVRGG